MPEHPHVPVLDGLVHVVESILEGQAPGGSAATAGSLRVLDAAVS